MKLPRRQVLHLAAGAAALPTMPRIAMAQAYPTRPVHWIVGFTPAGGKADDDAHRLGRIGLRPSEARENRQRGRACGQMQKLSAAE